MSFQEQIMSEDGYQCIVLKPNKSYCTYYPARHIFSPKAALASNTYLVRRMLDF